MFWAFEGARRNTAATASDADLIGRTGRIWFLGNGIFEPRSSRTRLELHGERNIAAVVLSLAGDIREPASKFDAEGRPERQDRRRRVRAQAQAEPERFGADMAWLHRSRVVDPALRSGPENIRRDRRPALRPDEGERPLDLAAERCALVDAERPERVGGGGLRTVQRKLFR